MSQVAVGTAVCRRVRKRWLFIVTGSLSADNCDFSQVKSRLIRKTKCIGARRIQELEMSHIVLGQSEGYVPGEVISHERRASNCSVTKYFPREYLL